jgi:hypothetical protein
MIASGQERTHSIGRIAVIPANRDGRPVVSNSLAPTLSGYMNLREE